MKRLTYHNGRVGSAKHNDRNFDLNKAKHIDLERTDDNRYFHYYTDNDNPKNPDNGLTFKEAEIKYYKEHFQDALDAKNNRYKKEGHKENCQTMEQYLNNKRSCPEESLYYVGNKDDTVSGKELEEIYEEYYAWHKETYPNIDILNVSIHLDEATPHIHERKVWITHDKDGNLVVGQNGALREMNISRPDPDKDENRYNNPKITYTKSCREKLQALCIEHGYELILEPTGKGGLELAEFKRQQIIAENEKFRLEGERIKQDAEMQALKIKEDAEIKAKKILKEAEKKKAEIEQETFDLETKKFAIETELEGKVRQAETTVKNLTEQAITLNEKIKNVDDEINKRVQERLNKEVKKEINKIREQIIEETKQEIYGKYDDWYDALDEDMKDYLQGKGLKDLLEEKIEVKRSYGMSR